MSDTLPDGRAFEAYRDDIQAYRQRQGLKPVSQTDARLLFEQAARQIPCEPPPATVSEHADDEEAFRLGLVRNLDDGYQWQRGLLESRWRTAKWFRPYVKHGGDRRSADQVADDVTWSVRDTFEEMRKSGEVKVTWRTLRSWLPLAEHDIATLQGVAHNVTGALKWCREQTMTPGEIADEKAERKERKVSAEKRAERDRHIIRDLSGEVSRLKALVDADLVEVVAELRREVAELKADNTAKRRRIEYLQLQAAHRRLSEGRGSVKVVRDRDRWCNECASPPSDCECGSVPEVAANGNGAGKADLFAHAVVSLPGEEAAT